MDFDGIWTPLVTPFDEAGNVDEKALASVIDSLIDHRVNGLIVGGTTGEYYALSNGERKRLFEIVLALAKGRITLMAGINTTTTEESLDLGRFAKAAGYEAILLAAPYYCQPTQDELLVHACAIDDALDLPTMLYNFPARTGTAMDYGFLDGLKRRPNFQAIKESTGSIERLHTLTQEYADQLQVCCGMDDQILEFFAWGSRSWVAGASNFIAREHVAMYRKCVVDKDMVAGRELAKRLLPMLNLLEQGGKFCQYVKYGCELAGLPVGTARRPLLPLNPTEKASFRQIYERLQQA